LGGRFELFYRALQDGDFFPRILGEGTNTAILLQSFSKNIGSFSAADSMPTSILLNLGFFGFILFLPLIVVSMVILIKHLKNTLIFQSILVVFLFSFTTVVTESYALYFPLSVLIFVSMRDFAFSKGGKIIEEGSC
jgi:hypothetical protein